MLEGILGGLESLNIFKGIFRGYAFYVTSERIIGAKMKGKGLRDFSNSLWAGEVVLRRA